MTEIGISKSGYLYDKEDDDWIGCSDLPSADPETDGEGWAKVKGAWTPGSLPELVISEWWDWPAAFDPVVYDGTYIGEHPTRYIWRWDVDVLARFLVNEFGVWVNTYYCHPPVWCLDDVSLDVWGPNGRGDPLDPSVGVPVFRYVFDTMEPPWIRWTIYQREIWVDGVGWDWYYHSDPPDSDGDHEQHIHFTFH